MYFRSQYVFLFSLFFTHLSDTQNTFFQRNVRKPYSPPPSPKQATAAVSATVSATALLISTISIISTISTLFCVYCIPLFYTVPVLPAMFHCLLYVLISLYIVQANAKAKFDETVEAHIKPGIDSKRTELVCFKILLFIFYCFSRVCVFFLSI